MQVYMECFIAGNLTKNYEKIAKYTIAYVPKRVSFNVLFDTKLVNSIKFNYCCTIIGL